MVASSTAADARHPLMKFSRRRTKALSLWWWNERPNFGDALSPLVVEMVSGKPVMWRTPEKADVVAVGSLIELAGRMRRRGGLVTWGTGCIGVGDVRPSIFEPAALRGPKTAALLGTPDVALGDPGYLVPHLWRAAPRGLTTLVIPHYVHDAPALLAPIECGDLPSNKLEFASVEEDPQTLARKISSAAAVVTSSLHVSIVARAYGTPVTVVDQPGVTGGTWKFDDDSAAANRYPSTEEMQRCLIQAWPF